MLHFQATFAVELAIRWIRTICIYGGVVVLFQVQLRTATDSIATHVGAHCEEASAGLVLRLNAAKPRWSDLDSVRFVCTCGQMLRAMEFISTFVGKSRGRIFGALNNIGFVTWFEGRFVSIWCLFWVSFLMLQCKGNIWMQPNLETAFLNFSCFFLNPNLLQNVSNRSWEVLINTTASK